MNFDFVLGVLDRIKDGGEVSIDNQMYFRVDIATPNGRRLATQAAEAAQVIRRYRDGEFSSNRDDALARAIEDHTTRMTAQLGELGLIIEAESRRRRGKAIKRMRK